MLDELSHSVWYGTKDSQITVFNQLRARFMAKASRKLNVKALEDRTKSQSAMLRNVIVPRSHIGGS